MCARVCVLASGLFWYILVFIYGSCYFHVIDPPPLSAAGLLSVGWESYCLPHLSCILNVGAVGSWIHLWTSEVEVGNLHSWLRIWIPTWENKFGVFFEVVYLWLVFLLLCYIKLGIDSAGIGAGCSSTTTYYGAVAGVAFGSACGNWWSWITHALAIDATATWSAGAVQKTAVGA